MAENFDITGEGLTELREAVKRNPRVVVTEVGKFLVRGIAAYNRRIIRSPWKVGSSGGGAPAATGNLRDTHVRQISTWQAKIYPTAAYAAYVHGTNGKKVNSRGVQLRPWLDYAKEDSAKDIEELEAKMLDNITNDLAK